MEHESNIEFRTVNAVINMHARYAVLKCAIIYVYFLRFIICTPAFAEDM